MTDKIVMLVNQEGSSVSYVEVWKNLYVDQREYERYLDGHSVGIHYEYNNAGIQLLITAKDKIQAFLNATTFESIADKLSIHIGYCKDILADTELVSYSFQTHTVAYMHMNYLKLLVTDESLLANHASLKDKIKVKRAEISAEQEVKRQQRIADAEEARLAYIENVKVKLKNDTDIDGQELLDLAKEIGYVIPARTKGLIKDCYGIQKQNLSYSGSTKRVNAQSVFKHYAAMFQIVTTV